MSSIAHPIYIRLRRGGPHSVEYIFFVFICFLLYTRGEAKLFELARAKNR